MYVGKVLISASTLNNWGQDFGSKPGITVLRGPEAALVLQAIVLCTLGARLVNCVGAPHASFLKTSLGILKMHAEFKSKDQHIHSTVFCNSLLGDSLRASDYDGENVGNFDTFHSTQETGRFLAAYGPYRQLQVCVQSPDVQPFSLKRVENFFKNYYPLTALGFSDLFSRNRDVKKRFQRLLRNAVKTLMPHIAHIEVRGQNSIKTYSDIWMKDNVTLQDGRVIAATNLGHKDQFLLAWVSDLIGHFILDNMKVKGLSNMEGLVVIHTFDMFVDTLEESELLRERLLKVFPRVQFIVTSAQAHRDAVEVGCVMSYPSTIEPS